VFNQKALNLDELENERVRIFHQQINRYDLNEINCPEYYEIEQKILDIIKEIFDE